MRTEDVFVVAPIVAAIGGAVSHFVLHLPLSTVVPWATALGLAPHLAMALMMLIIAIFFGGLNNDRPPCSCGNCRSNDYQYDDELTQSRNANATNATSREYCYRCPSCNTLWVACDKTFFRLVSDELVPYMSCSWGRWKPIS